MRRVGSPTIKNGCPVGDTSLRFSAHVVGGGISPRVVQEGAFRHWAQVKENYLEVARRSTWWRVGAPTRVSQPLGGDNSVERRAREGAGPREEEVPLEVAWWMRR